MAVRVINLVANSQPGVDNEIFASWGLDANYITTIESFEIRWFYIVYNKNTDEYGTYLGSLSTVQANDRNPDKLEWRATYSPPENWIRVKVSVLPISKTYNVNGTSMVYWYGDFSYVELWKISTTPSVPSVPTVEVMNSPDGKNSIKASLTNISDVDRTQYIDFQLRLIQKDGWKGIVSTVRSYVTAAAASCQFSNVLDKGSSYAVRSRAINQSAGNYGISNWSEYSDIVHTVPNAPRMLSPKAQTETSIRVNWEASSTEGIAEEHYEIEYATNLEDLNDSSTGGTIITTEDSKLYYIVTGLETGHEYFFRVRAVNSQGSSSWSNIESVAIGKKPNAPTTWSSSTTVIVGGSLNLYWVHNAEDNSTERYAEVEITIGSDVQTYTVRNENVDDEEEENTTRSYTIDTSTYLDGTQLKWRVRTSGVSLEYGDWSIMRTVDIYAPPTVAIDVTNKDGESIDTITSFPIFVTGFAGPSTQMPIGYHVAVYANSAYEFVDQRGNISSVRSGDIVYSSYIDTNDPLLLELTASNIDLQNGVEYKFEVIASMNSGLFATNSMNMSVLWTDDEYYINAQIALNKDSYSVYIMPYCTDSNGDRATNLTMSVYRREFDGSITEIASQLDSSVNMTVTDPHPSLDYARYRIVAIDKATGAVSFSDLPGYPIKGDSIVIQWDEDWIDFDITDTGIREEPAYSGSILKIPYNIETSENSTPEVSLVNYVGRRYPVSYYGTKIESTSTWNVQIPKEDKETIYALRRLQIWSGDVYVREPSGSGYWANIAVSFNQKYDDLTIPISLDITRVEGGV